MADAVVKFLLVDDLPANLVAMQALLQRDGLELLRAKSGAEALELLLVHDVALAILDVQMPEMDGFQLAELMRGTQRTRGVPIIFVTAAITENYRHFRGYELGAVDFLLKPIDPHVLRSKAEVFYSLARQRNELKELADELRASEERVRKHADALEKTVQERTNELTETVQELEAFSYSIAHDMRAPLRTMIGFSEMVCDETADLGPEVRSHLERIKAAAHRLDRLITDILRYSRVAREALPLEPVELDAMVVEVIDTYTHIHAMRGQIEVSPGMPPVIGNRAALTQVFSNLIGNALKFVPRDVAPQVRISARRHVDEHGRHWVRVSVGDNGIGIPPEVRQHLFQMFTRLTTDHSYEGTGIGLAIARKAVERMGGRIGVESEPGKGSTFWFVLPPAPDDAGPAR